MKKNSKNNIGFFPPEETLAKIREKMLAPNYPRINIALPKDATSLEKSKYFLCKKVLVHKQENNLSVEKLAQQINLTVPEVEDILFCRINKFTLDRLVAYANNIFSFHLAIHEDPPKKVVKNSIKTKSNALIARKTPNGRLRKHA
ncbi:1307_t:CDS:1 [Ambispora gerdemannii]|uniref:1307_t:CDS:1 n=1 Tax=Ambispora gerdemannii TaxID=144530 RepID=A0A9N9BIL5_9GLOM|nr:1307_t:CDS:1 [Ambispora gerdemannii]